ncbi:hypothetical protein OJAV_G00089080 [Oryzias javanicus]|uniref:RILP-like protein 1 n=2 Tax=Oryzias TaxID=8089 RepID=A0A3S2P9Y3_ORYJA|nr:hypothetical protein OJAV_G00089080 [Oryzias javanicus]
MSALERPAAELTVMDVYDIAAVLGQEFERVIDKFGCECLVGVVPRVVRVLELLEAFVNRGAPGQETEELRREVDRLQRERSDRYEQERRHQKEIEQVEDVWRGEVQDLLSQITQLQAENKRLSVSLSLKESPICEQDQQDQEAGSLEIESQMRKKLQDLVEKQRDEIRAKDHQLSQRNEDIEALQMQQHRLINMNQDLLHKVGVMESKGKTLIQQKTELEAAAQAQQKERGALQMEISKLRKELQERESQRKLTELEEFPLSRSGMLSQPLTLTETSTMPLSDSDIKSKSVLAECCGDPSFIEKCFERDRTLSLQPKSANRGDEMGSFVAVEDLPPQLLRSNNAKPMEDLGTQESEKPQFTLQELQDVLQERNELKVQVFMLQEELAYYKSEEFEEDYSSAVATLSAPSQSTSPDPPESGIRRLIFTAIMPMVAAGLISDDPTSKDCLNVTEPLHWLFRSSTMEFGEELSPALAFEKDAFELTVEDVYDISYVIGRDLLKISSAGEEVSDLQFRIVRVLEMFETLVNKYNLSLEELKLERDNLKSELDRIIKEGSSAAPGTHTAGPNQLVVDLTDPNRPRFTMQELKEVLQERNQLKAQLMVAQEELQLYKSGILPQAEPAMVEVNLDPPAATEHDPATINEKTTIGKLFSFRRK